MIQRSMGSPNRHSTRTISRTKSGVSACCTTSAVMGCKPVLRSLNAAQFSFGVVGVALLSDWTWTFLSLLVSFVVCCCADDPLHTARVAKISNEMLRGYIDSPRIALFNSPSLLLRQCCSKKNEQGLAGRPDRPLFRLNRGRCSRFVC